MNSRTAEQQNSRTAELKIGLVKNVRRTIALNLTPHAPGASLSDGQSHGLAKSGLKSEALVPK